MPIEYVPLLQLQRDIYRLPRNYDRFRQYLRTMVNETGDDLDIPPLVIINPMAREHVPDLLDQYLTMRADDAAAQAVANVHDQLRLKCSYKLSLVIADDLKGGWTNRYATEFNHRCGTSPRTGAKAVQRAAWLVGILWSSEPASVEVARQEALITAFRAEYREQFGSAANLRQMLAQEGYCMAMAGCTAPVLDDEELEYSRAVIEPHLEAGDMPTAIACLFGDSAARTLGMQSYGLSDRAGLALALYDARSH